MEVQLVPIDDSPIVKDSINLALIKNIILIDNTIETPEIFFSSNSDDTLPIYYNCCTDKNKLFDYLEKEFVNITRIGFIFNNSMMNSKYFLNSELFFTENDLIQFETNKDSLSSYSSNVIFLIKFIKKFDIKNVDFLACNSLEYDNWKKYYKLLQYYSTTIIGASKDLTGNINYGANWIMENTNEDIQNIYFNENITNYRSTLVSSSITYFRYEVFSENFFSINVKNVKNNSIVILNNLANLFFYNDNGYRTPLNPTKNYVLYYRNIINNTFISVTDINNMNITIYPEEQYEILVAFQTEYYIVFGLPVEPNTLLATDNVLSLYSGKSGKNSDPNAYNTLSPNSIYNSLNRSYQLSYTLNYTLDKFWKQVGQDINGDYKGDELGRSVSLSADGLTVAIGAYGNDGNNPTYKGQVRVLKYSNSSWTQLGQDIDGENPKDFSGISVSLSADGLTVAIGAEGNDGNGDSSGHVRVYKYSNNSWTQVGQDIDGENPGDYSGRSVSLSADGLTVAIGAPNNRGDSNDTFAYKGQVRVHKYSGSSWTQLGQDIDGEKLYDFSGRSVSLSADGITVAIGAYGNDGNGDLSGHVRVYKYSNSSWTQVGQDIDGENPGDFSGISVSLSSDGLTVAIGAYGNRGDSSDPMSGKGHVRVLKYSNSSWTQVGQDIDGENPKDGSGSSVSLSADGLTVAIGAPGNAGNAGNVPYLNKGQVRVYKYSNSSWTQIGEDIDGENPGDYSGRSVSLSANGLTVAIGALFNNGGDESDPFAYKGEVRVYKNSSGKTPPNELINSKTQVSELIASGTTSKELIASGITSKELIEAGFTASVMKEKGYDAKDLKQLDYSVKQMKQSKFTLSSLLKAGFLLGKITAYYKAEQFLKIGIGPQQLREKGISNDRLKKMGFL
jgi:hypothetical protein